MRTKEFTTAWEKLEYKQKEVAEWDEGAILALAGPGTGKTRVLTCRIARILDSSRDKNFRILALTFTNKAADEIRKRIMSFVPGLEGRLFIGTFHSFCADVLRQHGIHLGINPNFHIYSQDNDLLAILDDAVEEAKKKSAIVSNRDKQTLPVIKHLKSSLILPDNCSKDIFKDLKLGERMSIIYPAYEMELTKQNALDFNSLILKTYQLFSKFPAFAKRYRTVYPYICIDEFQDTNQAQYALIKALTDNQHKNIFVVADDDQIMYQWNGASSKRITKFKKDYLATVIQLPVNYRCPPEIVELANNLIRHNTSRTPNKTPLEAYRSSSNKDAVHLLPVFDNFKDEATGIAGDIKKHHLKHLDSTVVLGRNRKLLQSVESALHTEQLPAIISQRKNDFESIPFVWLHSILRLANNRQSRNYLKAVCGTFSQLTKVAEVDPDIIIAQAQVSNNDYLQHWIKSLLNQDVTPQIKEIINHISSFLGEGRNFYEFSKIALDWFSDLAQQVQAQVNDSTIDFFIHYKEECEVWEKFMENISTKFQETTLEAFLQELQMYSKETVIKPNTVRLMTIHGSKGKEFNHVYLVGLVEDELPSFYSKQKGDNSPEMEEERRNCFVAITRTVETLTLSYSKKHDKWVKEPSRFLFEMGLIE